MGLQEFVDRYGNFGSYPAPDCLLPDTPLNPGALRRYDDILLSKNQNGVKNRTSDAFFAEDSDQKVSFREILDDGSVTKYNCLSDNDMREWLCTDDPWSLDGQAPTVTNGRRDPLCRLVFIHTAAERGEPLIISQESLSRLLTFHQVSPAFLEILNVYRGTWSEEYELRSTLFRTSSALGNPAQQGAIVPELGRSGRHYQVSWNVRIPMRYEKERGTGAFYRIRQVAFHHKFDVGTGCQLWLVGDPGGLAKMFFQKHLPIKWDYTGAFCGAQAGFRSSLDMHVEVLRWAIEQWSGYLQDLDTIIRNASQVVLHAQNTPDYGPDVVNVDNSLPSVTVLEGLAEEASKILIGLASNERTMRLLESFYEQTLEDPDFKIHPELNDSEVTMKQRHCEKSFKQFQVGIGELKSQYELHLDHVRGLVASINGLKDVLAQLSQHYSNNFLNEQAERGAKEAIMVRIVTIITLVYLPPTFTSTFFSMDMFKGTGLEIWATVSFPLLVGTLILTTIIGYRVMRQGERHREKLLRRLHHQSLSRSAKNRGNNEDPPQTRNIFSSAVDSLCRQFPFLRAGNVPPENVADASPIDNSCMASFRSLFSSMKVPEPDVESRVPSMDKADSDGQDGRSPEMDSKTDVANGGQILRHY